jgi:primosomal protein N' (replication factor Y)
VKFAEILFPIPVNQTFTYFIPETFNNKIEIGFRVIVNFGKNKLYTGIVIGLHNSVPSFTVKPILEFLDSKPFVDSHQLAFIKWISDYYCCPLGDVLKAAIPDNLLACSETRIYFNKNFSDEISLSEKELQVINYVKANKDTNIQDIRKFLRIQNPIHILNLLESKEIINIGQKIINDFKPKYKKTVFFDIKSIENNIFEYENIVKKNGKQNDILNFLIEISQNNNCNVDVTEIVKKCQISSETLKILQKKQFLTINDTEISRIENFESIDFQTKKLQLSDYQNISYLKINNSFNKKIPVLLHGVTSSGKTEIYIQLIKNVLAENKSALFLLPEIALTTQMISRLKQYFGNDIAVFHSKYPVSSRAEIYQEILNNNRKVVLGVRSAIFLPFQNLGLIIVDEEHEQTYKQQDPAPRYNARDIALVLAKIHNANVILGSATPSIESYFNATSNKYNLVELTQRFGNVKLPEIIVANMKDAYRRRTMISHFHPILIESIKTVLGKNEQIILFQNRRGYSQYLECKICGWVPFCEKCNVSLTFHKRENKLLCHYCGKEYTIVEKCKNCGETDFSFKGLGTEKIEGDLQAILKNAKIKRLDADSATSRTAYEKILTDFENHDIDILVGTQMITKGLDFQNVSLVGILNADNLLNMPDFRAFEKAFQMMMQVSGRAGRRENQGKVIVQTFEPENQIIKFLVAQDYQSFYFSEIQNREKFNYPPFSRFIVIKLKAKNEDLLFKTAFSLANILKQKLGNRVKGPEEPVINKINNLFFLNVYIRIEKNLSLQKTKLLLLEECHSLCKKFKDVKTEIDVDII